MKYKNRITSAIIALIMLLSCFSCSSSSGGASSSAEPDELPAVMNWTEHMVTKLRADRFPDPDDESLSNEYTVYMAKGETEGCQLVFWCETKLAGAKLVLKSGDTQSLTYALYSMENTHPIKMKEYTDSAVPYNGKRLILEAEQTIPFIVDFTTSLTTPAGDYDYVFEMIHPDGRVMCDYKVKVHVWDFALPQEKTFATAIGITKYHIQRLEGFMSEDLYKKYYDMLLEHNMCGFDLPYDILDDRADEYMSDPRVTSFVVPNTDDDALLVQYYNKIKSNPVWFEKAIIYPLDEPSDTEALAELKARCERISRLCPELKMVSPFYTNVQTGVGKDQVDQMSEYTNLWCPKLCLWDDSMSYSSLDYTPSASFADRMEAMKKNGDVMWSYICNHPTKPYLNIWVDYPGIEARVLFWQQYQRGIDGFLYWSATSWGYFDYLGDPWRSPYTGVKDGNGNPVYGEGFLFYPGRQVGIPGPIPSIRMKIMRDGIDDIEMFMMAEKYLDKDVILDFINRVTPTLTSISVDDDAFQSIRIEFGNLLEKSIKGE